jgi:hypothetical protein
LPLCYWGPTKAPLAAVIMELVQLIIHLTAATSTSHQHCPMAML